MFSKETYVSRRAELRKLVKSGIVILFGNNDSPVNYPSLDCDRRAAECLCRDGIVVLFKAGGLGFDKLKGLAKAFLRLSLIHILGICPFMVDDVLKHCGNSGFSLCKIRILINYKYDPLLFGCLLYTSMLILRMLYKKLTTYRYSIDIVQAMP